MPRFKHQTEIFERTRDLPAFYFGWEVRVGKTYPTLDTAYYHALLKNIDTVLIWTTNGNHLKWAHEIIPAYIKEMQGSNPQLFPENRILLWQSNKSQTQKYEREMKECEAHPGLLWFCINFEALSLDRLETYVDRLIEKRKGVFLGVDEAHRLKTPSAQSTKAAIRMSARTKIRRALSGSMAPKCPFDLWSQFQILDPKILNERFTAFKTRYGIFKKMRYGHGPVFDQLDVEQGDHGYKDLDKLQAVIAPYLSRLTQKDVYENLPKEIHETRTFEMSPKQRKAYNDLKEEMMTILESGEIITATQAIVCVMRLQQVSRGFVGDIDGEPIDLGGPYPAIESMFSLIEEIEGKVIIWCRFTAEIDLILRELETAKMGKAVRYDGQVSMQQREINVATFQTDPSVRFLVGNPAAKVEGKDMTAATATIYSSSSYNLVDRDQSWGRVQGPNQKSKSLYYVDMRAEDGMDDVILENLATKTDLASSINGDKLREILRGKK